MRKPDTNRSQVAANGSMIRRAFAVVSRYRPRVLTLVVLAAIAAVLVVANSIEEHGSFGYNYNLSYGWPLTWRQYTIFAWTLKVVDENYSAGRLAANIAIWLVMLAAPAGVCEWLLRRYRPRWRFSLRTLLVATGLAAVLCAWFAAARHRANVQDSLIADLDLHAGRAWGERWGPKWLDQIGADRFCRRILGVHINGARVNDAGVVADRLHSVTDEDCLRLLGDSGRLPDLQYLSLRADDLTPEIIAALGELRRLETLELEIEGELKLGVRRTLAETLGGMRRLRALSVSSSVIFSREESRELLAAIGSVGQLEHLRLENWMPASEDLALLAGLTNLKSLKLEDVSTEPGLPDSAPTLLAHLPPLARLEVLDLERSKVVDRDLPSIARLPRLKSLNFCGVYTTGGKLAELALEELTPLKSLEKLTINDSAVALAGWKSLAELKRLKKLHAAFFDEETWQSPDVLSEELHLSLEEAQACSEAYAALRKANPGLVIDDDDEALNAFGDRFAQKGEHLHNSSESDFFPQAIQVWRDKQAGKAAGPGAASPPGAN
jgi:hypothetical protein